MSLPFDVRLRAGNAEVALVNIDDVDEGWYYGNIRRQSFPLEMREELKQYDDALKHQILDLAEQICDAINGYGVVAVFPDGAVHPVISLHITKADEVSFRISPIPGAPRK